jgi:GLPGLI family protein
MDMTKIIFQTVLTFWVVTLETNAQRLVTADYVVTYEFTSTSDTTLGTFAPKTDFILRGLGNESHFHSANRQFNDSMNHVYFLTHPPTSSIKKSKDKEAARSNYMGYMSQWFKSTVVDYKVQKQFNDGIIKVNQHHAFPYRHLEISTPLPWKISPIRDTIKGLFCQKATLEYGGRMYSACLHRAFLSMMGPIFLVGYRA